MTRIVIILVALVAQTLLWLAWVGMVREYPPETLLDYAMAGMIAFMIGCFTVYCIVVYKWLTRTEIVVEEGKDA